MKFFITLCVLFGFCMSAFGEEAFILRLNGSKSSFTITSKVDYLRIDNFIVNRGRCETTWFTTNYIGEKPVEFYVYSDNNGLIINKNPID